MRYFFPLHYDAGNRGCEAIARGTAMLLQQPADNLLAYCRDMELDSRMGLDQVMTLVPYGRKSYVGDRVVAAVNKLFHTETTLKWRLMYIYRHFMDMMRPGDVMISTGGDMMCYGNNEIIYTNDYAHRRGYKTILWGCSMGPENLTPEKQATLARYSLIYVRESLTYDFMRSLGMQNLCLCPDPAFILPAEECALPECLLQGNVLGLNLSSYVLRGTSMDSAFGRQILTMMEHVLRDTDLHILLIPHVTWHTANENQDDREISHYLQERYGDTGRVTVLDIQALNYCQIRYVISHCRFFIGARTHSVISAYTMQVPTIALGYSIKSKGIAHDLGLPSQLVVDSRQQADPGELTRSLDYLMDHEAEIRQHMAQVMPPYIKSTTKIREYLSKL